MLLFLLPFLSLCPFSRVHFVFYTFPGQPSDCRYRVGVQKLLESSQCRYISLYFSASFCLAFPATPGSTGRGGVRGGEWCHSRYEERLAPLSLAPNAGVI